MQGKAEKRKAENKAKRTKGCEEMKQKITNAEAVQAADTLRKFCMQFKNSCYGCPFYWREAGMMYDSCRLYKYPTSYNLRSPKKVVEAEENAKNQS